MHRIVHVILTRVLYLIPVLFLVTLATTALVDLLPGNPAVTILGPSATSEQIARINEEYGFENGLFIRYVEWVGGAVTGDLGNSLVTNRPVGGEIAARLPVTVQLTLMTIGLSLLVSVSAALIAAVREDGVVDRMFTALASASMSIPSFVAAVLLVFIVSVQLKLLPVSGYSPLSNGILENLKYMILPVLTLSILEIGFFFRILRGDLGTTLREDFMLVARSKGLNVSYVMLNHALRPSLFSLMAVIGLSIGRLLGGSVIIEVFFGVPGLGQYLVGAITNLDIPVIQATIALIAIFYVVINSIIDLLYSVIDPRVKVS